MGPVFLNVEKLLPELEKKLAELGAQPFSSRGIDGSTLSSGFLIVSMTSASLKLLREFIVDYFAHKSTLQIKYKGATLTGYNAAQVSELLDKMQRRRGWGPRLKLMLAWAGVFLVVLVAGLAVLFRNPHELADRARTSAAAGPVGNAGALRAYVKNPPPTRDVIEPAKPAAWDQSTNSETAGTQPAQATPTTPALDRMLLARGDQLLAASDAVAARLLYQRAAANGSAQAMTAIGGTYDPLVLADQEVRGVRPQPRDAIAWYERATAAGDARASGRLRALVDSLRRSEEIEDAETAALLRDYH